METVKRLFRHYVSMHYDLILYGPRDRWGSDFYRRMRLGNRLLWFVTVWYYGVEKRANEFGYRRVMLPCDKPGYVRYTFTRWCTPIPESIMHKIRRVRGWLERTSCGY